MQRFFAATLVIVCACGSAAHSQTLTDRIDALQMTHGHLPGAYLQNAGAGGLRWYFSMTGVHAVALDNKHDKQVNAFLDSYLGTATRPGGAINDVVDLTKPAIVWKLADSDDSYAARMLSLASWFSGRGKAGEKWFKNQLPRLKFIATANLLDVIDPQTRLTLSYNGMPNRLTAPLPAGQEYHKEHEKDVANATIYSKIGQVMDNCEAYRGLKDFAARLKAIGDPDAEKYEAAAKTVAAGIAGLYDPQVRAFRVNTDQKAVGRDFYPGRFVQAAPQVFEVDFGMETKAMYDGAWTHLNAGGDRWWEGKTTDDTTLIFEKQPQKFPCMMLAYAAKLRGDKLKLQSHLKYFKQTMEAPGTRPEFSNIDELGWALRASRQ